MLLEEMNRADAAAAEEESRRWYQGLVCKVAAAEEARRWGDRGCV